MGSFFLELVTFHPPRRNILRTVQSVLSDQIGYSSSCTDMLIVGECRLALISY